MKVLFGVLLLALTGTAQAGVILATASLDYSQEVDPINPNPSTATGHASLTFDTRSGLVDLEMSVDGISVSDVTFPGGALAFGAFGPLHIHLGAAGSNGPIEIPFNQTAFFTDTATGMNVSATNVAFDTDLVDELRSGDLYLNLHSLDYASGEIRGQIAAIPEPSTLALFGIGLLGLGVMRRRRT